eukprot:CAMPEP_0119563574 /NCGR_PEP_ID=MMETSP1352-20130426/23875_1 /TAXON_ID=265584 /ORGANISM="Stauroneis constricta, Strain CCMP1120" /LENGTH=646 /DNA_ID=CAMNT_0007612197 /DNA_START=55 /DNA_END=1992 /DNA_ORIENTATION=+
MPPLHTSQGHEQQQQVDADKLSSIGQRLHFNSNNSNSSGEDFNVNMPLHHYYPRASELPTSRISVDACFSAASEAQQPSSRNHKRSVRFAPAASLRQIHESRFANADLPLRWYTPGELQRIEDDRQRTKSESYDGMMAIDTAGTCTRGLECLWRSAASTKGIQAAVRETLLEQEKLRTEGAGDQDADLLAIVCREHTRSFQSEARGRAVQDEAAARRVINEASSGASSAGVTHRFLPATTTATATTATASARASIATSNARITASGNAITRNNFVQRPSRRTATTRTRARAVSSVSLSPHRGSATTGGYTTKPRTTITTRQTGGGTSRIPNKSLSSPVRTALDATGTGQHHHHHQVSARNHNNTHSITNIALPFSSLSPTRNGNNSSNNYAAPSISPLGNGSSHHVSRPYTDPAFPQYASPEPEPQLTPTRQTTTGNIHTAAKSNNRFTSLPGPPPLSPLTSRSEHRPKHTTSSSASAYLNDDDSYSQINERLQLLKERTTPRLLPHQVQQPAQPQQRSNQHFVMTNNHSLNQSMHNTMHDSLDTSSNHSSSSLPINYSGRTARNEKKSTNRISSRAAFRRGMHKTRTTMSSTSNTNTNTPMIPTRSLSVPQPTHANTANTNNTSTIPVRSVSTDSSAASVSSQQQ